MTVPGGGFAIDASPFSRKKRGAILFFTTTYISLHLNTTRRIGVMLIPVYRQSARR